MDEILSLIEKLNFAPEEKNLWQEVLPEMNEEEKKDFRALLLKQLRQKDNQSFSHNSEIVQLLKSWKNK